MAAHLVKSLSETFFEFEKLFFNAILRIPQPQLEYNLIPLYNQSTEQNLDEQSRGSFDLREVFDGFLWGVPTGRRTLEKRWTRRCGVKQWNYKLLVPRKDLQVCNSCGHYHECNSLCPNCYDKVKLETKQMQDKIVSELGLNPIESEVVVLYEGEKETKPDDFFQGKRIVEMKKPRPAWFSQNLLQKSTSGSLAGASETMAVKPVNLG